MTEFDSSIEKRSAELLSAEEEIELSKRIRAGKEAEEVLAEAGFLPEAERLDLEKTVEDGESAYEKLVLSNRRLAKKFAAETARKNPNGLNDDDDYYQVAVGAISAAARSFDWQRGCRFSTYAWQSMKREMIRENARMGYAVSLPEDKLSQIAALKAQVDEKGFDEAVKALGIAPDIAGGLLRAASCSDSLQDPISDEDPDTVYGDTIPDLNAISAEEIEARIDRAESLRKARLAFSQLPEDEQVLMKGRLGFDGPPKPMKDFVGTVAKSISGVQKKELAAKKHLREIYLSLPTAG